LTNLNLITKSSDEKEINSAVSLIKEDLSYLKDLNDDNYKSVYDLVSYYYENLLKTNDIELINNTFAL
jgi:mannose/fructose/N-acetylgalactosamine-specific phosphotransferase system component IIB